MASPFLTIAHLSKTYRSGTQSVNALKDISLSFERGEVFGLLGANGAGKTTLSSILATLHPPTSGTIFFEGKSIYDNLYAYRRALGFCPQSQNVDSFLTVEENLLFAGRYYLMHDTDIKKRIQELYTQLELTPYAHFMPDQLSGGNRQRLLIARALIHRPKLVILDEPTVGLDPDIRQKLWTLIRGLKEEGITVILTTHYLDEAEQLSDRICMLHKGTIKLVSSVAQLRKEYDNETLEDIFLELMHKYSKE
jgi:ABC-2 type transport system ATP-binding protein